MTLKSGQLIETQVNDEWQSTKYWDCDVAEWSDVCVGTPCLIVSVDPQKILFTCSGRIYSIHNCYDSTDGVPVWCKVL